MSHTNPPAHTQGRIMRSALAASVSALLLSLSMGVQAANTFDPATNTLTLETVDLPGARYESITAVVHSYDLLGVDAPGVLRTTFDPATNTLTLAHVMVGNEKFHGVRARINSYELRGPIAPPSELPTLDAPAPTYAEGSAELAAYRMLSQERERCGFGVLRQDARLDTAARAHAVYMAKNFNWTMAFPVSAAENPSKPAFYEEAPWTRAPKAGYPAGPVREVNAFIGVLNGEPGEAAFVARVGLASPLVAPRLLSAGTPDFGIGADRTPPGTANVALEFVTMDFGGSITQPMLTSVQTYPCEGATDVRALSYGEMPGAFFGRTTAHPIYVFGDASLKVSEAVVLGPYGDNVRGPLGRVEVLGILGAGHMEWGPYTTTGGIAAIVLGRLEYDIPYNVTIKGTNKGVPFVRSFSFRTAKEQKVETLPMAISTD